MRNGTVHLIGHAHIDPVWLWEYREGFTEVRNTFRSVLNLMSEYPEWKFTASSSCFYEWVLQTDPDLFKEIQKRVREGRWEYTGAFYVEPDCNLPCGESFVRHGIYSQRFFETYFGNKAEVAFAPDSFGHAGSLPQILTKLGIQYYVFMRPTPGVEKDFHDGTTFIWRSKDGSSVIASVIPHSYGGDVKEVEWKLDHLDEYPYWNRGQKHFLCFFGVCNHGGGPTRETIQMLMKKRKDKCYKLQFSTLKEFFDTHIRTLKRLPELRDELQYHARGCYSTLLDLKRMHRETEHKLLTAERFATAGWLMGVVDYPERVFEAIWKDLLFNQFHDILGGTCIKEAYEAVWDQLGSARHRADVIINWTIQHLARSIDTRGDGNPIVVVNPLPWPVKQPVTVSETVTRGIGDAIELSDDEGNCCAIQPIVASRPGSKKYVFVADVPSLGYRVYFARKECPEHQEIHQLHIKPHCAPKPPEVVKNRIENDYFLVEFDTSLGGVESLYDKRNKVVVSQRGAIPVPLIDSSDTWSHNVGEYRVEKGKFRLENVYVKEKGEVLCSVVQEFSFINSRFYQEWVLYKDLEVIDVNLDVLWLERYTTLKWAIDTEINGGIATYEVPYGVESRPCNGEEQPGQQWIDLSGLVEGKEYGLGLITDSCYGYDVKGSVMRITLLRSPVYAHHDPDRVDSVYYYPAMDQGWKSIRIRLFPHPGHWMSTRIVKTAWEFNVPLIPHYEATHKGSRDKRATLLGTEAENVLISVVKKSEEGNDLVIRAYETNGVAIKTNVHIPIIGLSFPVEFKPYEIKTWKVNINKKRVIETNLLEES